MQKYEKITIDELTDLVLQSGWERTTFKAFHFEFIKGDRILKIREYASGNWELVCVNSFSEDSGVGMLSLPYILSIPPAVLFATLEVYGIVSMLTLASSIGLLKREGVAA